MIPDLSVVWVIAFVLVLAIVIDRLLLRPVTRVMREREGAIHAARELADASRTRAQAASDEFEAKTQQARADVFRQMDERRRDALDRRAHIVTGTRQEIEAMMHDATGRLATQAAAARAQIDRDADSLAATIVERVLGRKAS